MLCNKTPVQRKIKKTTTFCSGRKTVELDGRNTLIIGERINPTGKKRLKEALREKDYGYVINDCLRSAASDRLFRPEKC